MDWKYLYKYSNYMILYIKYMYWINEWKYMSCNVNELSLENYKGYNLVSREYINYLLLSIW